MKTTAHDCGSRFELKYLISEKTAARVSEFVQTHLNFDTWSVGRANYGYPVHTIYLDSENLRLYWNAIEDPEHRWQLRLRYYSAQDRAPVFCEIKRWNGDTVIKESCRLRRQAWPSLLAGQVVSSEGTEARNRADLNALERFVALKEETNAAPRLHVNFLREGYQSVEGDVRITLDRSICFQSPPATAALPMRLENPGRVQSDSVLLELKFTDRYPQWYAELVETLDLLEGEFDKYLVCCSAAGALCGLNLRPPRSARM